VRAAGVAAGGGALMNSKWDELKRWIENDFMPSEQDGDAWYERKMGTAVLELIAQVEQLKRAHEQICTNYNKVSYASSERGKKIEELTATVNRQHETNRTLHSQLEQKARECEELRQALRDIVNHVEGNSEELVRELVNWGTPRVDPNQFYDECSAIKAIAYEAMAKEGASNG